MLDVDDNYPEHPKLVRLGTYCEVAGWLNLAAMCWCKRYLTDGVLPHAAVWRLASFRGMAIDGEPVTPEAVAAKLVAVGLWTERGESYVIHDFLDYQESRETVLERRRIDRERKRQGNESRHNSQASAFRPDSGRNPDGIRAESGRPLPLPLPEKRTPDARARALQSGGHARAQNRDPDRTTATVTPNARHGPLRAPVRLGDLLAEATARARAPDCQSGGRSASPVDDSTQRVGGRS